MDVDAITARIIGGAIAVHRELGPGLLESTYEHCLEMVLKRDGLTVERQVAMPIVFMGERIQVGYRIDMLVEGTVVVEIKAVARIDTVHFAQMMTYLRLSGCGVGLLINFNETTLRKGIRRVVRGYRTSLESSPQD